MKAAGPDSADLLSVHFYGNNTKFKDYGAMLDAYGKPGWNTETGTTCNSFFTTLPSFGAFQQEGYRQRELEELHRHTQHSVKNYLLSLSLGKMEKWFQYFARFTNASPSQPTKWSGNGKEIVEYDGSLRGNGVGLTIASHFIDGAKYDGPVEVDERMQAFVFQKGDAAIGFFWANPGQTLTVEFPMHTSLTFHDIMGNPVARQTIEVDESPVYFTFKGDSKQSASLLKTMKLGKAQ